MLSKIVVFARYQGFRGEAGSFATPYTINFFNNLLVRAPSILAPASRH